METWILKQTKGNLDTKTNKRKLAHQNKLNET